jgi:hypothetical protein
MTDRTVIKYVRVHPNYITQFSEVKFDKPRSHFSESQTENLRRNNYRGHLSKSSVSKCRKAINYLMFTSSDKKNYEKINWKNAKFRIAFVTLTLSAPQRHTDNVIKRDMLNPFLIELKRQYDIKNYVWRAERQVNGNIHFHLLIDKFVPWHEIRGLWNRQQSKLGYIREYQSTMREYHSHGFKVRADLLAKWPLKDQLRAYSKGKACDFTNPNSTDIHSVKFVSNVAGYVTKYMTKEEDSRHLQVSAKSLNFTRKHEKSSHSLSVNVLKYLNKKAQIGRLWACSVELTSLTGGESEVDSTLAAELTTLSQSPGVKYFDDGYCRILIAPISLAIKLHCTSIVSLLSEFVCSRFILNI